MTADTSFGPNAAMADLMEFQRQTEALSAVAERLAWDQETVMPRGAVEQRSEEMAAIEAVLHERRTDPRIGEWLAVAETQGMAAGARILSAVAIDATGVRSWTSTLGASPGRCGRKPARSSSRGPRSPRRRGPPTTTGSPRRAATASPEPVASTRTGGAGTPFGMAVTGAVPASRAVSSSRARAKCSGP